MVLMAVWGFCISGVEVLVQAVVVGGEGGRECDGSGAGGGGPGGAGNGGDGGVGGGEDGGECG